MDDEKSPDRIIERFVWKGSSGGLLLDQISERLVQARAEDIKGSGFNCKMVSIVGLSFYS